jgi:MerR family transcriptional regulator, light-induced transcriptional regulator
MDVGLKPLEREGLRRFQLLRADAASVVTDRFYAALGSAYDEFGTRGHAACREDLAFHREFLQPVLEFGLLRPMVVYLRWLISMLAARSILATTWRHCSTCSENSSLNGWTRWTARW